MQHFVAGSLLSFVVLAANHVLNSAYMSQPSYPKPSKPTPQSLALVYRQPLWRKQTWQSWSLSRCKP